MSNFKKLFAIDLDGTLLTKTKKIKKEDFISLKRYHDLGGEIVIITGKSITSGLKYVREIEKKLSIKLKYASFLAGAIIFDLINNRICESFSISGEDVEKLSDICIKTKCDFIAVNEINMKELYSMNKGLIFNWIMKKFYIKNSEYIVKKDLINTPAYKFNVCKKPFLLNHLKKIKNDKYISDNFHINETHNWFYEITKLNANKANALEIISNKLGISINNTASIGDSPNDIPMLKVADLSFGIGNKNKLFKESSNVFIKSYKKNPVSYAINYMLDK